MCQHSVVWVKWAAFCRRHFSAFYWMKMYVIWFEVYRRFSKGPWLGTEQRQAIALTICYPNRSLSHQASVSYDKWCANWQANNFPQLRCYFLLKYNYIITDLANFALMMFQKPCPRRIISHEHCTNMHGWNIVSLINAMSSNIPNYKNINFRRICEKNKRTWWHVWKIAAILSRPQHVNTPFGE